VRPRRLDIPGIEHEKVLDYVDVLHRSRPVGNQVAIIGAGGIGFDVAEFLLGEPHTPPQIDRFIEEYGVDVSLHEAGGLRQGHKRMESPPKRGIVLLQRKKERVGARLAVSTGWIRRDRLNRHHVKMLSGVEYRRIDDLGLHVSIDGINQVIPADNIIICAGQDSERDLYTALREHYPAIPVHLIGGADQAVELDAMRAIDQATRLATQL
jgi:2,4-dienoyl-CoA reductase (NADPH2)